MKIIKHDLAITDRERCLLQNLNLHFPHMLHLHLFETISHPPPYWSTTCTEVHNKDFGKIFI